MSKKRTKSSRALMRSAATRPDFSLHLLADVRDLILAARRTVARGVNAALVRLYWQVGERVRNDILQQRRAKYGQEILPTLSAKLVPEFGEGFSERNLARMISFAEAFDLGLILCAEKSDGRVELLELENRGIRIAEYLTELPPKKVLEEKLHQAVLLAPSRLNSAKAR